jgi:hypothetical protein
MAPYEGKRVKIIGTQRADLNGQFGQAQKYDPNTQRYVVRMSNGKTISLKPTNLEEAEDQDAGAGAGAGFGGMPNFGGMPGMGSREMQEAQRMVQQWLTTAMQMLPAGVSPQNAGYAIIGLVIGAVFLVGFMRAMILLPLVGLVAYIFQGGLGRAKGRTLGVGARIARFIRQKSGANSRMMSDNIGAILLLISVPLLFYWAVSPLFGGSAATASTPPADQAAAAISAAYHAGWEDAHNGHEFGTNLPSRASESAPAPAAAGGWGSVMSITNLLSLVYLGNTIYSLGKSPAGGWDPSLAVTNGKNMPTYQKFLFGMMIARLLGFM